ncbi:uncharacterized protein LOC135962039 [Calliphora vicina]|uniref:uncharacterized protein LOC135962039 n=1 Tax=Calliphora vicina TaxID=7373 RepID=UPI00325A842A
MSMSMKYTTDYFSTLPEEIVRKIFNLIDLQNQLVLAKVSKYFRQVIEDIYKRKFNIMYYDYWTFKSSLKLQDWQITELCRLCNGSVERINLVTFFFSRFYGISQEEEMKYLQFQKDFRHNLQYFNNLRELEIEGNTFLDETVLDLAKYCKGLKSISFKGVDIDGFLGKHLHQLENIENMGLKYCSNLDPNHLLAVSQKNLLKSLNIVYCSDVYNIPTFLKLCNHWLYLESLILLAFTSDTQGIQAIINLPSLKTLQFYWNKLMWNKASPCFEETFFLALKKHHEKALKLKHIQFSCDSYIMDFKKICQPLEQARKKEELCAQMQSWKWPKKASKKICSAFAEFKNLHTINFHYCRPLDNDQLIYVAKENASLRQIKIEGCLKVKDGDFKKRWANLKSVQKCQLELESILPLADVKKIYDNVGSNIENEFSIARIISCHFC